MGEGQTPQPSTVVVLGIPFHNVSFEETVAWARDRIRSRKPGYIATANIDFVMQARRDPELQRILLEADLVVADGIPIVWLSGWLGPRLKARVTGSDLVPLFAEMARDNGFSLFNLGGAPGVAEKAAEVLVQRFPGLRIAGCYSPPKADVLNMNHAEILARLEAAQPDLLLVAFGAPKQEKWVNFNLGRLKVPVSIGIGGSLDFLAGAQTRAPKLVQRLALEWLWRMLSDPPRLFRRYVGNIGFLFSAVMKLLAARLGADRAEEPLAGSAAAAELGRLALVEAYVRIRDAVEAEAFQARLAALPDSRPIVLDLAGVPWLSSLELGVLLRLTTFCRGRNQGLLLTGIGTRVRRLLALYRLTEYLELTDAAGAIAAATKACDASAREGRIDRAEQGRLTASLPTELMAANLDGFKRLWEANPDLPSAREWILDASLTRFVDSAALGFFVGLKKRATDAGIALRFTGVQARVRQTCRIARVESVLLEPEIPPADATTSRPPAPR